MDVRARIKFPDIFVDCPWHMFFFKLNKHLFRICSCSFWSKILTIDSLSNSSTGMNISWKRKSLSVASSPRYLFWISCSYIIFLISSSKIGLKPNIFLGSLTIWYIFVWSSMLSVGWRSWMLLPEGWPVRGFLVAEDLAHVGLIGSQSVSLF